MKAPRADERKQLPFTICRTRYLEYKRYHVPSRSHRFRTKLLRIPSSRANGRRPQIRHHKRQAANHGPAEPAACRRGHKRNGEVNETLAGVVRADEELEEARGGQRVLFQARKVPVALILLGPSPKVNGHGRGHARGEDAQRVLRLPRLEDGICNQRSPD